MRTQTGPMAEDRGPRDESSASAQFASPASQGTSGTGSSGGENGFRRPLSPREFDVLRWLSEGKSGAEIAKILHISLGTVRVHIRNINRKLAARNIAHAVAKGFKRGILG